MLKARVNGIDIHYIERGEGKPLLLVHGFQDSHVTFTPIIGWLSERFRVLHSICAATALAHYSKV